MGSLTAIHGRGQVHAAAHGMLACDVLDAWFPPSPAAILAGTDPSLFRQSPDLEFSQLANATEAVRGVPQECLSFGAGSSEIIHRVLPRLAGDGPVLLSDPTYSEYGFLFPHAQRYGLSPNNGFRLDPAEFAKRTSGCTLAILVNAQNPTGGFLTREQVLEIRTRIDPQALLLVDEAYVDFAGPTCSVERDVPATPGLLVLKSLSKAYA